VGSNNVGVFVNSASVIVGSLAALTTLYGGIYLIIVSVDTDVADGNTIILYFVLVLMSVIDLCVLISFIQTNPNNKQSTTKISSIHLRFHSTIDRWCFEWIENLSYKQ